jgi:hypothetical protein
MRLAAFFALAVYALQAPCSTAGEVPLSCPGHVEPVGPCTTVHGRLAGTYFGNYQWRIWVVGTHHFLAIEPEPDDARYPTTEPLANLAKDKDVTAIYADFTVCPLSHERAGSMGLVCLVGAKKIVTLHCVGDRNHCRTKKYADGLSRKGG